MKFTGRRTPFRDAPLEPLVGHSVFIRPEKTFTVEVYEVRGRLGDPDFGFPGDVTQVLHHSLSIKERGHKNKTGS